MFFARAGKYEASGLFSIGHFSLLAITIIGIIIALKKTIHKNKDEVLKIIRILTITVWILEVCKISFNMQYFKIYNVKEWVPLYYCSILLYAGLLSSFGKGKIKRVGDVFLATGCIIGGIVFAFMPTTSLPTYPAFHFISFHSFFFHGTMVYIALLVLCTHYIEIEKKDYIYFAILVGIICALALFVNVKFDSNLMFISKNFPNTPIERIYNLAGPVFTPFMIIGQMTIPFWLMYGILSLIKKINKNEDKQDQNIKEIED